MGLIQWFSDISFDDTAQVGGKNASLGFMLSHSRIPGVRIPDGFAITVDAYWQFIHYNNFYQSIIKRLEHCAQADEAQLAAVQSEIRPMILAARIDPEMTSHIVAAYQELSRRYNQEACDVAVRSSAVMEDSMESSCAGQQESILGVRGVKALLLAYKQAIASLFTHRSLAYSQHCGMNMLNNALSVGVQKMVRSDTATAGVAFSLDTETGLSSIVTISAAYGLGELVVQGVITPDEFYVHKDRLRAGFAPLLSKYLGTKDEKLVYADLPERGVERIPVLPSEQQRFSLSDEQVLEISRLVILIEEEYKHRAFTAGAIDVEWAYDGDDGNLYILQVRPETVHSKLQPSNFTLYTRGQLSADQELLVSGQRVGHKIVSGTVCKLASIEQASAFQEGSILVTGMTDPDWMPLLRKAVGLITDRGGRTCHAAIVSRELGIPAVVGTHDATARINSDQSVTLDCSQGTEGYVYKGVVPFRAAQVDVSALMQPAEHGALGTPMAQVMVNCADPRQAFQHALLPVAGVGLARLEFIIATMIGVHPLVFTQPEVLDTCMTFRLQEIARAHTNPQAFFIETLAQAIGMLAGAFYPRPVIVRLTDFKSNEYRDLLGGSLFEPVEENPMLGFRGAVRYLSKEYRAAFELECRALKKAREDMGFDNIIIMVPFVRTLTEARGVLEALSSCGLKRSDRGLKIYMMVEVPSNVLLIEEFAELFDGLSIGSNDLTQLTLGVDRDSGMLTSIFDERDPAVKKMLALAIEGAKKAGKPIGICGQAPSDFPELADFLLDLGITSLSLNPDAVIPFLLARQKASQIGAF